MLEAATLIVAAIVCALVANAFASRERKVTVVPAPVLSGAPPLSGPPPPSAAQGSAKKPLPPIAGEGAGAPLSPSKTTTRPPPPPTRSIESFKPHPNKAYVEIHGDDVAWLHAKGVLFLDARRTSVYEQGHIPGARPFSVWESDIDDKVRKFFDERNDPRDQEKPIVIYCSGGDCEDSHMLAQTLWGIQFNNVYVYKDGFPDWQQRGEAIHTGANP